MIDEGRYRAHAVAAALGRTSKGRDQIAVQFELTDPKGARLTWYGFFTDDTFERTVEALRACGWRGEDLDVFAEGKPLPADMKEEVEVVVEHNEYEGKVTARIAWVNSGGGIALKETMSESEASAFSRRMRGRIAALDRANGRGRRQTRPPAGNAFGDVPQSTLDQQEQEQEHAGKGDDVPF